MRFLELAKRNLKETYRDPIALGFLLAFPLMFMLLFGVAFGGDITPNYPIGMIDNDQTQVSQAFIEALSEVEALEVSTYDDTATTLKDLKLGDLTAYIVIPPGFGEQVVQNWQGKETSIILQMTYDESDLMVSEQVISIVNTATRAFARIEIPITIDANPIHIETEITHIDFIAPGIIIFGLFILIPTSARIMLRDKEKGFLSRLLTTPARPWEFISGYSISTMAIATVQIIIFIVIARLFGMDIVGSSWLAFLIFFLVGLSSIGIGMVVASLCKSENQGESLSWLFTMPLAIISGVWFSVELMPSYIRTIAYAFPFAHAVEASRAVLTRGVGLEAVSSALWFLVGWAVVIFAVGVILFRRSMRS